MYRSSPVFHRRVLTLAPSLNGIVATYTHDDVRYAAKRVPARSVGDPMS